MSTLPVNGSTLNVLPAKSRLRACAQCRKRKMMCDRMFPCGSCVSRGQQDDCDFDGSTPLALNSPTEGTEALRRQLTRMKSYVDILSNIIASNQFSQHAINRGEEFPIGLGMNVLDNGIRTASGGGTDDSIWRVCEGFLGEDRMTASWATRNCGPLYDHLRAPQTGPTPSLSLPPPLPPSPSSTLSPIVSLLPARSLSESFLTTFFSTPICCFLNVVDRERFTESHSFFWTSSPGESGGDWVAVWLAVGAIGLSGLREGEGNGRVGGMGKVGERTAQSRKLVDASYQALQLGNFLNNPTLDTIRALLLIQYYWVFFEHRPPGNLLPGMIMSLALEMRLNEDPEELDQDGRWEEEEKDDRKKVWAGVVVSEGLLTTYFSRTPTSIALLTSTASPPSLSSNSTHYSSTSHLSSPTHFLHLTLSVFRVILQARYLVQSERYTAEEMHRLERKLAIISTKSGADVLRVDEQLKGGSSGEGVDREVGFNLVFNNALLIIYSPFISSPTVSQNCIAKVLAASRSILSLYLQYKPRNSAFFPVEAVVQAMVALFCLLWMRLAPHDSILPQVQAVLHKLLTEVNGNGSGMVNARCAIAVEHLRGLLRRCIEGDNR